MRRHEFLAGAAALGLAGCSSSAGTERHRSAAAQRHRAGPPGRPALTFAPVPPTGRRHRSGRRRQGTDPARHAVARASADPGLPDRRLVCRRRALRAARSRRLERQAGGGRHAGLPQRVRQRRHLERLPARRRLRVRLQQQGHPVQRGGRADRRQPQPQPQLSDRLRSARAGERQALVPLRRALSATSARSPAGTTTSRSSPRPRKPTWRPTSKRRRAPTRSGSPTAAPRCARCSSAIPDLVDGGVDWSGVFWSPNLSILDYLPKFVAAMPAYVASGFTDPAARAAIVAAGLPRRPQDRLGRRTPRCGSSTTPGRRRSTPT